MNSSLETLKKVFAEILLCSQEELNLEKPYVDMGVDSILAIQLAKLIKLHLNYTILPSDLYNFNSIRHLSEYIDNEHTTKNISITCRSEEQAYLEEDKIAIIGIAGRFPQANSTIEYWNNLLNGICAVQQVGRWSFQNKIVYHGGFLSNVENFDADFFNISPREALMMDPQQRTMMEVAFHAFEDAGMSIDRLNNAKGAVITTSLPGDYKNNFNNKKEAYSSFSFLGNAISVLSGRISYFFNLKGPSLTLDTACSSSIVALQVAYNYLQNNLCDFVLVGASSIFSTPELFYLSEASNLLSKSGLCRTFDKQADGFIPAETVCCLVLRKLSSARKERQQIYAIIEAVETNHDGFTNGLMSPNSYSQKELILSAYKDNNIDPSDIGYIEAHGTGTPLGDPLEVKALRESFEILDPNYSFNIGSSKANVGHALVASGMVSIAKILYTFKNSIIPPQINFGEINPQINLGNFKINKNLEPWPENKNLAAINALGFSGTNAHLILRKPQKNKILHSHQKTYIFIFTAQNLNSLRKLLQLYIPFIESLDEYDLGNLSYSLNCKTSHLSYKFITFSDSKKSLINYINHCLQQNEIFAQDHFQRTSSDIESFIGAYRKEDYQLMQKACQLYGGVCVYNDVKNSTQIEDLYIANYQKISLPNYPFNQHPFWVKVDKESMQILQEDDFSESKNFLDNKKNNGNTQYEQLQDTTADNSLILSLEVIKNTIKERISSVLGYAIEQINEDKSLSEYGVDSLVALQLLQPFSKILKVINPNIVFDYKSIKAISEYLFSKQKQEDNQKDSQSTQLLLPSNFDHIKIRKRYVSGNKVSIEWFVFGNNADKPILLLSPLNTLAHVWIQQIRYFTRKGYQVFIPHYPGHGGSTFDSITLEEIAEEIMISLSTFYQFKKMDILGWSLGGCLTLLLSYIAMRKVNKVVLVSSAAKFENDVFSQSIQLRDELSLKVDYLKTLYNQDYNNVVNYISANCNLETLKYYYDILQGFNFDSTLSKLPQQYMIFYGLKDPVITLEETRNFEKIKNMTLITCETEGHFIPLTAPFLFNTKVEQFIAENI